MEEKYTRNEAISWAHQDRASSFRAVADFVEKFKYPSEDIIALLRETANEAEAQAIVVELRDTL